MTGGQDAQYTTVYDAGVMTVTVNGHANSLNWGSGATSSTIAAGLASSVNGDSNAPVTASASGSVVTLTAKTSGASTNYSLSSGTTYDSGNFSYASFSYTNSGGTLTGGHDIGVPVYDAGTMTITVNSHANSVSWGQGSTAAGIASSLASAINGDSGSAVTANANSATVNLTAKTTGTASNYSLSSSYTFASGNFSNSSFTTSNSGASLTGGQNAVYNTVYDTGTITATVNGTAKSVSYGQSSTPSSLASALAVAFNGDSGSPVTATAAGGTLALATKAVGSVVNYSLSASSSTGNSNFTGTSFPATPSGAALTGGSDPGTYTPYSYTLTYAPNGDILNANDSVNGSWTYTYDTFNRLKTAVATNGSGCSWDYDRYGNRWHQNTYNGSCLTPTGSACARMRAAVLLAMFTSAGS